MTQSPMRTESAEAYVAMQQDLVHISGYLLKLTRDGKWQRRYAHAPSLMSAPGASGFSHRPDRWFETNGCFLTYYKSKKMEKLLAALNLPQVGEIKVEDDLAIFSIELNERVYQLKAANEQEARKWVETLKVLKESEKKRAESTKAALAPTGGAETAVPSSTDKQATAEWEKSKGCCRLCRG